MLKNDSIDSCFLWGAKGALFFIFTREKLEKHFLWRREFKFDLDLMFPRKSAHVCKKNPKALEL